MVLFLLVGKFAQHVMLPAGDEDVGREDCYDKWVSSLVDLLPEVPMGPWGSFTGIFELGLKNPGIYKPPKTNMDTQNSPIFEAGDTFFSKFIIFGIMGCFTVIFTLPPIIMEVENSPFGDYFHIFQEPIFH